METPSLPMTSSPPASPLVPGKHLSGVGLCWGSLEAHGCPYSVSPPFRYVVLSQPICLEQGVSYTLRLELGCAAAHQDPTASVLIDSVRGRQAVGCGTATLQGHRMQP